MRAPWLEEHAQLLVVVRRAGDGPADVLGDVVVAEAHGVGVAEGARPNLRGGPLPQSGQGAQLGVGVGGRQPFEGVGDRRGTDQRAGPGRVDVHPQPLPGRDAADRLGGRLQPQPELATRTGRALAVAVDQSAEAGERLLPRHLLLDDGRHQGLPDPVGSAEAQRRPASPRLGDDRVQVGPEVRDVVVGAEQRRHVVECPLGTGAPGLGADLAGVGGDLQRHRAVRRTDAAPHVVPVQPERRVTRAAAVGQEQAEHRDGSVGPPHPLRRRHGPHANRRRRRARTGGPGFTMFTW